VKLLLDEHYSPVIAEHLRRPGYDVIPVAERTDAAAAELRSVPDEDLLRWAATHGRILVTEDVGDFMPIHRAFLQRGQLHAGILFTSPERFSRSSAGVGAIVTALSEFIDEHEANQITGDIAWLQPAQQTY